MLLRTLTPRSAHLSNANKGADDGRWTFGGAMLNAPIAEGQKLDIDGSVMLAVAESREEVLGWLREDIYAREDVWDVENAQIMPFKSAIRRALQS